MREFKETKKLLRKLGQSGKYKFRFRELGRGDNVFYLQKTPLDYWLLSYMERGQVVSEEYLDDVFTVSLYIGRDALNRYKSDEKSSWRFISDKYIEQYEQKFILGGNEAAMKVREPWWKNNRSGYSKYGNEIKYCFDFLSKTGELKKFSVLPDSREKEQKTSIVCDVHNRVYYSLYPDRNIRMWGKAFRTYQEAFLYIRSQALTTFYYRQKIFIEQWRRDLEEGKTRFNFLFRTDWNKRPEKIGRFTKKRLIRFLSDLKYCHNSFMPDSPYGNEEYTYHAITPDKKEVRVNGSVHYFRRKSSAIKYLFDKDCNDRISKLYDTLGNERKALLCIYEQELERFWTFYRESFEKEYKQIETIDFGDVKADERKLLAPFWKPYDKFQQEGTFSMEETGDTNEDLLLERYGNLYGNFVSCYGTPFELLGLAPVLKNGEYHVLKVNATIPVDSFIIAPAFGSPGGGRGFRLHEPISELMRKGTLELIR